MQVNNAEHKRKTIRKGWRIRQIQRETTNNNKIKTG
jgi:hypothetical protein